MCLIRSLVWKHSVSIKSNFWLIRYTQDRCIGKILKSYGFILVISRGELAEIKGVFEIMYSLSLSKVLRIYVKLFLLRNTIRKVKIYWWISHGWVDNDTSPCAFFKRRHKLHFNCDVKLFTLFWCQPMRWRITLTWIRTAVILGLYKRTQCDLWQRE